MMIIFLKSTHYSLERLVTDGGDYKCKTKQAKQRKLQREGSFRLITMDQREHGVDSLYMDRVSNYSLSQLRQEPGKLKDSLQKLKVETEEMSVGKLYSSY